MGKPEEKDHLEDQDIDKLEKILTMAHGVQD
jgi:hypothetical protein